MTNHLEMIERLKQQNMLPDTTEPQREANIFRCEWLERLHRDKPTHQPTIATDIVMERLKDKYLNIQASNQPDSHMKFIEPS
ncbi:hypothetical protein [Peribacillus butanolivorans]